jgi:YD repeat-containing protein
MQELILLPTPPHQETKRQNRIPLWVIVLVAIAVLVLADHATRPRPATVRPADLEKAMQPARLDGHHPCVFGIVSSGVVKTAMGACATPTERVAPEDRFEVDLRYGAFVLRQTDLAGSIGSGLSLDRAYSSNDWSSPSHAFGFNSSHNYDTVPTGSRQPYTYMLLMLEDSDFLYFPRVSAGSSYEDAVYLHTETSTRFYGATIAWNGDGWTLHTRDGEEMRFPEAYGAKNMAQGAAYEITDAHGAKIRLERDGQRNLRQVLTAQGRWIRMQDDDAGRITRASSDDGAAVEYRYNGDGMLEEMKSSNGTERHYAYVGRFMTVVTDEKGTVLIRNWYRSGLVIRQLYANGDVYTYDYAWTAGQPFVNSAVVTLPDKTQRRFNLADSVSEFLRRK